jgi:hypothetical protein
MDKFVREVEIFETATGPGPKNLGGYYFRLRAYNGEIVAQSEKYESAAARTETAGKLAKQLGVPVNKGAPVP